MNHLIVALGFLFGVVGYTASNSPPVHLVPKGCNIANGSKKMGYELKCKHILPTRMPLWKYKGIDLIPIDKKDFIERRIWTHGDWVLTETSRCNDAKCGDPKIFLLFGDHCGAP